MDETKKSHKVRNIILIVFAIILVVILAVGIYYGRNYFIIGDILSKQASLKNCTNYYFTTEDTAGESTQNVDYKIKDGKANRRGNGLSRPLAVGKEMKNVKQTVSKKRQSQPQRPGGMAGGGPGEPRQGV